MTEKEELKSKEMYEKYANNASEEDIKKIAKKLNNLFFSFKEVKK